MGVYSSMTIHSSHIIPSTTQTEPGVLAPVTPPVRNAHLPDGNPIQRQTAAQVYSKTI